MFKLTPSRVSRIAAHKIKADRGVGAFSSQLAVAAANSFIDALSAELRAKAIYAPEDPRRPNWSNLPAGILDFERNGVRIADLSDEQVEALFHFLSTALSAYGYRKVVDVVGADEVLSHSERAGHFAWTDENYWLAFFGAPSDADKWGWQFGGHHLGVNVVVHQGRNYTSPTFIGVEPASYEFEDGIVAPLAAELEAGIALVNALSEEQRMKAMVDDRPLEVWTAAGNDGFVPPVEGSLVSHWSGEQQRMLLDMIPLWLGIVDTESSSARMAEIADELDELCFAWHGLTDGGGPIYYRIQGPSLIIEYSTQGGVGADSGHYHSIYRDPTNEYGANAGLS